MNITQQLCCAGAAENQDYIRLGEDIAMVVDGSTPLVKDPRVPEVREYVRLLADAVVGAEGEDLPHMVAAGIETLRRRYGVLPETEGVSAALAILRETGEQVEGFVLGDCAAGVRFRDGRGPELVSQEAVSRLDGAVVAEMCRLHRERGIDVIEARQLPEVREMLLRHRRMMNRPGGYWIAGFAPEAARHGTHRVYRREELSRVVLFSDGFSGQREALLGAEEPCLQELYRQLRQREAADSRCNRYPRLKPGDDVSGIVAVF